ncbi:mechanosensitive ion channel protein MscS [Maricaulis sp. W15]|uniref:Mechanosensitive ion channel-like protein n=1 Tax=Maricaulis maris TaxID=74318 RepID=A0A495D2V9_9PROT|nr:MULTISPECIES: mechanosensitive ion channel domain-containing protein [Maricaulis]OLF71345.1 mechanosensitive ion channel protein MscS [Maricaulis sp. W15]RKQ96097.1 mechanosensitive ion channel-like protein [Maricaulis maris]
MKTFLLSLIKPNGAWAGILLFATLVGVVVAGTTGHLDLVRDYLDTPLLTFSVGSLSVSAYDALRGVLVLALVFWTTAIVSAVVEGRLTALTRIRPTTRILITKVFQIVLYVIAFLVTMDLMGLDLTTLTVFSGALGIGLGFGLQKIASNFISGLILLLERSVEQDDLIELPDGVTGFVRKSSARYTLIETVDGKEILVPNEDLITNRVTNWTLTNTRGRIEVGIGVSYGSDLEAAQALILEAAREHPSTIEDPAPQCFLRNFGDSSVDFTLLFWIDDVVKGRWAPQSEVMFAIWRKFRDAGIEIPFPQRDVHIKSSPSPTEG